MVNVQLLLSHVLDLLQYVVEPVTEVTGRLGGGDGREPAAVAIPHWWRAMPLGTSPVTTTEGAR
jgi:hypothetical protein